MLLERVHIDHATYGIYRPALENHVFRDITISNVTSEPFNRGMDDATTQFGRATIDGLTFMRFPHDRQIPLIQISDNNPTGTAESHFRNVQLLERKDGSRRALVDRGGGARPAPLTAAGVPVYLHDYYGPGRTAKVASTLATNLASEGSAWRKETGLTGADSVATEVQGIQFPQLLEPTDDLAPATIITGAREAGEEVIVTGVSHDNGDIASVTVNGREARITSTSAGVVDWKIALDRTEAGKVIAFASDKAGNVERTPHEVAIGKRRSEVAAR
jgi:hypothetical protein